MGMAVTESRHSVCVLSVSYGHGCHTVKIFSLISISVLMGMAVTESRHSVRVLSVSCGHGCHISGQESSPSSISVIMGMVVT